MKIWLLLLFAAICGLALTGPAFAGSLDFTIENQTGFDIYELYVAPYQSGDWGKDILAGVILADGNQYEVALDNPKGTYWDIMIRDQTGKQIIWRKFNLKKITKITLSFDGKTVEAEYE
jgi:hypothetical protein